ncbi:hypothetical protein BRD08_07935 [Halobacteriales archaeon SW_10_66_29]|nr:MAG: hypothetical protein BRD08_07935 [Halobacteriales archaeon SW_10_66_29]
MGYRCPVCGDPQADGVHLANHLAFTAMVRGGEHEDWLDEHVPDWAARGEDGLAAAVTDLADSAEYPQVFDDTTGNHNYERGQAHGHGEAHDHGRAGDAMGADSLPVDVQAVDNVEMDEEAAEMLAEAREMTRERRSSADEDTGAADESDRTDGPGGSDERGEES